MGLAALVFSDDCPPGNMPSYQHMKADALSLADPRSVVLLLEDDYLLQPSALQEMVEVRHTDHTTCTWVTLMATKGQLAAKGRLMTLILTERAWCDGGRCSSPTSRVW